MPPPDQTHTPHPLLGLDMPPRTRHAPPGTKYTPQGPDMPPLGLSTPPHFFVNFFWLKYTPPPPGSSRLRNTDNERPVRILLECILVIYVKATAHEANKHPTELKMFQMCKYGNIEAPSLWYIHFNLPIMYRIYVYQVIQKKKYWIAAILRQKVTWWRERAVDLSRL